MPSVYTQVEFCTLLCCLLNFSICIIRFYQCEVIVVHKLLPLISAYLFTLIIAFDASLDVNMDLIFAL